MENNWQAKSLQNLEKRPPVPIEYSSYLVKRCTELLNQPLNEFSVEDIRIMIGQEIGLNYLVLLAIDRLKTDVLSEGDYYPGDLLTSLLKVNKEFWSKNRGLYLELLVMIEENKELLIQAGIPLSLLQAYFESS